MKLKKVTAVLLTAAMTMAMVTGCGSSKEAAPAETKDTVAEAPADNTEKEAEKTEEKSGGKITFMVNVVGEQADILEKMSKQFEQETGNVVEFSAPGKNYEELMKTKMSSNELPDVFSTHGWSVARYSEYLMPVNDQPFYSQIKSQMLPVITSKEGETYVLPIDANIAGMVYNLDVLEDSGVNVDDLKTWDDFAAACDKIKAKGYTPVRIGGKDQWTIGQYFDWVAPSFYITDANNSKAEELKAGKFDTATWEQVGEMMKKWLEAGYFNEDVLTADYNADIQALATNKAAFCFYPNSATIDMKKVNPEAKVGMMAIPAVSKDDEPSLIAGEGIAVGVWKDSPNKEIAVEFLNYLAKPEVMSQIATVTGNQAGLEGVTSEIGELQQYYDKYSSLEAFPYFDREYLPSGLWDVMCTTGAEILAGTKNAVPDAGKVMEQSFNDKFIAN